MLRWLQHVALAFAAFVSNGFMHATAQISVPDDAQFVFQIDLQAIQQSSLGRKLIDMAKQAAAEEIGKQKGGRAGDDPLEKVRESLGFDPLTEVQRIVVTASDFEHPEKSLMIWLHMKKTTGNLEGLLLGLPNYESEAYGKHEIHSAKPDNDRVFGAIHRDGNDDHVVLISPNRSALEHQLDLLDKKSKLRDGFKIVSLGSDQKSLLSAQVLKFPLEEMGEGPHTNVAKRLKSLTFAILEQDDDVDLRLQMETETEKQAQQIRQMVQGLIAMVEFAQSMETEDEDLKQAVEFLKDAKSSVDGTTVKMRLRLPADAIERAIRNEMD